MKNNTIHLLLLVLSMSLIGWAADAAQPVITLSPPIQLTTNQATQLDPAVSGDIVVYTDMRNGNEDIYYYDLSTGIETQITTSSANQRLHDVSGSRIVYSDLSTPGYHIGLYDVSSGSNSSLTAGPSDLNPRIDGDIVVFERGPSNSMDVIAYDLGSWSETPVAITAAHELNPVVSGRRVAYERHVTATAPGEIVVFDLDTHAEIVLGDSALDDRRPDIDGDLVVWDVMTAAGDLDIILHDLSTGITRVLAMAGNQRWAHVSGRVVVFDEVILNENGFAVASKVLMHHVDSGQTITVAA
jgi:beta propeller repeat protein